MARTSGTGLAETGTFNCLILSSMEMFECRNALNSCIWFFEECTILFDRGQILLPDLPFAWTTATAAKAERLILLLL